MVYDFPIEYMHCLCLGVMKRILLIWLGRDKMYNSRKYRNSLTHELNKRIAYLASQIQKDIFSRQPRFFDYVMF